MASCQTIRNPLLTGSGGAHDRLGGIMRQHSYMTSELGRWVVTSWQGRQGGASPVEHDEISKKFNPKTKTKHEWEPRLSGFSCYRQQLAEVFLISCTARESSWKGLAGDTVQERWSRIQRRINNLGLFSLLAFVAGMRLRRFSDPLYALATLPADGKIRPLNLYLCAPGSCSWHRAWFANLIKVCRNIVGLSPRA